MSFPDCREPLQRLGRRTGPPTASQVALAGKVGLALVGDEPHDVVAVMLEQYLKPEIWGIQAETATQRQLDFLGILANRYRADLTKELASAWITHHLAVRTGQRLRSLRLKDGDAVIRSKTSQDPETNRSHEWLDYLIVSSIGSEGLVYFRGGNGQCAWPSTLARAKSTDDPKTYPRSRTLDNA